MEILIVMIIFSTMTVSLFSLMNYAQKFFQENLAEETIKDQVSYAMRFMSNVIAQASGIEAITDTYVLVSENVAKAGTTGDGRVIACVPNNSGGGKSYCHIFCVKNTGAALFLENGAVTSKNTYALYYLSGETTLSKACPPSSLSDSESGFTCPSAVLAAETSCGTGGTLLADSLTMPTDSSSDPYDGTFFKEVTKMSFRVNLRGQSTYTSKVLKPTDYAISTVYAVLAPSDF